MAAYQSHDPRLGKVLLLVDRLKAGSEGLADLRTKSAVQQSWAVSRKLTLTLKQLGGQKRQISPVTPAQEVRRLKVSHHCRAAPGMGASSRLCRGITVPKVNLQLNEAAAILAEFGLGEPVALTELEGGRSGSFRIDRAVGDPVVLKTYGDFISTVPQREVYASNLLSDLAIP